jgi:transglutaminase/protease-like cytokinesis protein 3
MVFMSYQALQTKIKGQNQTLLQKLVADKAVSLQAAQQSGLYHNAEVQDDAWPISTSPVNPGPYTVNNHSELSYCLEKSILGLQDSIVIKLNYHDALDNFEAAVDKALHSIEKATGLSNLLKSWKYQGTDESITVTITYRYTTQQLTQLKNERDRIISDNITASMSDYEKEKVLHDYIIEHCRYDYQNLVNNTVPPDSYTAYGVLLKGSGVCQ